MKTFYLSDINLFIILMVIGLIFLTGARRLLKFRSSHVFIGLIGLLIGALLGDALSSPLSQLPAPWGRWVPIVVTVVVTAAVVDFFLTQVPGWIKFVNYLFSILPQKEESPNGIPEIIVDSSAFIDGRIEEVADTGFVLGKLIIPRFVLEELQSVSDSADDLKRMRGRKGLEVLSHLSKHSSLDVEIIDTDFKDKQVDKKLVKLAKLRHARLLTCDYNLNKVADISGIDVLNLNELSNALRPIVLPGENLKVKIVTAGKEKGQGVGYFPDGTMIVVEGGEKYVGEEINCRVERIFQTVAGKMIFAVPHL